MNTSAHSAAEFGELAPVVGVITAAIEYRHAVIVAARAPATTCRAANDELQACHDRLIAEAGDLVRILNPQAAQSPKERRHAAVRIAVVDAIRAESGLNLRELTTRVERRVGRVDEDYVAAHVRFLLSDGRLVERRVLSERGAVRTVYELPGAGERAEFGRFIEDPMRAEELTQP